MGMFEKNETPEPSEVCGILDDCVLVQPENTEVLNHAVIQRFGNPLQQVFIFKDDILINDLAYKKPIGLPICDSDLKMIQLAVLQDDKRIHFSDSDIARGFAYFGQLRNDQPVIITYGLEAFFKIAQTNYAVVLVVLPHLCKEPFKELNQYDFQQILFVVKQLQNKGFSKLFMPVRVENIKHHLFQNLEQSTSVKLINQFVQDGEINFLNELQKDDESEEVRAFLDYSIQQCLANEWGEILPLSNLPSLHDQHVYPIHALPLLAQKAAIAISEHIQVPISMAAQCVIGTMSHIAQSKVNAPHPFKEHGEPCSVFLLTEGQSGSRKSTSRNMADKAIHEYELKQYELYRLELDQWKCRQVGLSKKDRESFAIENPPPNDPSMKFSDVTLEALASSYVEGTLHNASISSDEAGQFFGGPIMKSDNRPQVIGSCTKLFDDGYIERTRSKSNLNGSGRAYDVRLTFNLQGQREVLIDAIKDPLLRGQGFLARFILVISENLAGTRLQDEAFQEKQANHDNRLIEYWNRCEYLLDGSPTALDQSEVYNGRSVINLNDQAKAVDLEFYNLFESLQADGKCFAYLQAFASRGSQLARRLATIFAYFEGQQSISAKTLRGACEIIQYSLNEWHRYSEIEVNSENDAEKLFNYFNVKFKRDQTSLILKTQLMKGAPLHLRPKKIFNEYLQELIDSNYVRLVTMNRSSYIEINPLFFKSDRN